MKKDGYADITPIQARQIGLVSSIIDGNIPPDGIEDGWQVWHFATNENREPVKKEPIRIKEEPKFIRKYYK